MNKDKMKAVIPEGFEAERSLHCSTECGGNVYVSKRGRIYYDKEAAIEAGLGHYCLLVYDTVNRRVGMVSCEADEPGAKMFLRPKGKGNPNINAGPMMMKRFGTIPHGNHTAHVSKGFLYFNLEPRD